LAQEFSDVDLAEHCPLCGPVAAHGMTIPLTAVAADLRQRDVLEREVTERTAAVRALLPPEHRRLVWALQDAEERLALAERLLTQDALVDTLIRHMPEHAMVIRHVARQVLGNPEVEETA
jgi:hypothetical protein